MATHPQTGCLLCWDKLKQVTWWKESTWGTHVSKLLMADISREIIQSIGAGVGGGGERRSMPDDLNLCISSSRQVCIINI